jgi:outer membrane translocation and assembly module TamA
VVVDVVSDLPASERFFTGGDTTVRGFSLDQLGTPDTLDDRTGFPLGGNGVIVLNAELRVPVWRDLGIAAFMDGGNVFRRAADISLDDIRGAAGIGLRYRSPIGPLRLDLGFKLDRRVLPNGQLERPRALHISLGQARSVGAYERGNWPCERKAETSCRGRAPGGERGVVSDAKRSRRVGRLVLRARRGAPVCS